MLFLDVSSLNSRGGASRPVLLSAARPRQHRRGQILPRMLGEKLPHLRLREWAEDMVPIGAGQRPVAGLDPRLVEGPGVVLIPDDRTRDVGKSGEQGEVL